MKTQYKDYGAVANIVITSTVFEFRKQPCGRGHAALHTRNSYKPQWNVLHEDGFVR